MYGFFGALSLFFPAERGGKQDQRYRREGIACGLSRLCGGGVVRGRVGRGAKQSYCIFIQGNEDAESRERLNVLLKAKNGFEIAEEDLRLRGPGDFFGIRQSGGMDFRIADIIRDAAVLKDAKEDIEALSAEESEAQYNNLIAERSDIVVY